MKTFALTHWECVTKILQLSQHCSSDRYNYLCTTWVGNILTSKDKMFPNFKWIETSALKESGICSSAKVPEEGKMNSPSVKSYKSQEDWLAPNSLKGLGSIYLVALLQLLWHENYCHHICNSTRGKRGMLKKYRFLFLQK